jgi:hypothetical protein
VALRDAQAPEPDRPATTRDQSARWAADFLTNAARIADEEVAAAPLDEQASLRAFTDQVLAELRDTLNTALAGEHP